MPAILVIGGAGYIGSHICKHLQPEALKPVVLDNLRLGHKESVTEPLKYSQNNIAATLRLLHAMLEHFEKNIQTAWDWHAINPEGYATTKVS